MIDSSGVVISADLTFTGTCGLNDNGPNAISELKVLSVNSICLQKMLRLLLL